MKYNFDHESKKKVLLPIIVVLVGVASYFIFYRFSDLKQIFDNIIGMLTPFILGFAFAFLLYKPMLFIQNVLLKKVAISNSLKRSIASVLAIILGIVVVILVCAMLLPQIIESFVSLVNSFPGYINDFQKIAYQFIEKYGIQSDQVIDYLNSIGIFEKISEFVSSLIPRMLDYTLQFGSIIFDLLVAIISALYMLVDKERLSSYAKKSIYALCPMNIAQYLHRMTLKSGDIFNNFIVGKAIDSTIIGILCYIGCSILQLPYALLLSVFVGVTNMIPVFGPFIGAIPGVFILLIINPIQSLYFVLFIFALQQFDGNILGPYILGDQLGIPSIGILFSVTIGAGLFGLVGMFIGVPAFAVVYYAYKEFINDRLKAKEIDVSKISVAQRD